MSQLESQWEAQTRLGMAGDGDQDTFREVWYMFLLAFLLSCCRLCVSIFVQFNEGFRCAHAILRARPGCQEVWQIVAGGLRLVGDAPRPLITCSGRFLVENPTVLMGQPVMAKASDKLSTPPPLPPAPPSPPCIQLLAETNPIVLVITFVVSLLHSIFNFLAFKNDIHFWKDKKR